MCSKRFSTLLISKIRHMTNVIDIAKKCFQDEAQAILNLIPKLDDNFTKAIELIIESKGKLVN